MFRFVPHDRLVSYVETLLVAVVLMASRATHADETVTLARRQFAANSPAAAFQSFFSDARKLAASTTPAWHSADDDLAAWGPALIYGLLDRSVSTETILGLAAPLEGEATAPALLLRTLGLYAAKSRVPFVETPSLRKAIDRNLHTIERATRDLDALTSARSVAEWGSIGTGAWLAYLELLYRDYFDLGNPGAAPWDADGVRIVDQLLVRGQLPEGKGFRRDPRDDQPSLWPTALAIYALVKAYESQELVKYETAAIAAAAALDGLRDADGSYFSTTAKNDKNARANAYMAGALLLLFKDTGDVHYRDRAAALLRWLISGPGATATAREASLSAHVAFVVLLLDSVTTQPFENVLSRRPMRVTNELAAPSAHAIDDMAKALRPADFKFRPMFDGVLHTLIERVPYAGGDVAYDYGDAPGYAVSVLLAGGDQTIAPQMITREERLLSWPHPRDFDEISFGADALFAALDRRDGTEASADSALRRYLLLSGSLAVADRYYFDWLDWFTNGGGFEYGPTVVGAQIAATQLRYAERFPERRVGWFLRPLHIGQSVLEAADRAAWDAGRWVYRARPQAETVWLLPNAMMIIDLVQAGRITADAAYIVRAEAVAGGLDVLWDEQRGAYGASSEQLGDNAYESLSTNSYAALAFWRLWLATQKPAYRERALRIVDFINRDLYADGVVYHHLYRGRRAAGDIWCTGCNWRVLALLREMGLPSK